MNGLLLSFLLGPSLPLSGADRVCLDCFGDPLPDGAIVRLGTVRFRPSCGRYEFAVTADGKTFATAEDTCIRVWDSKTGLERWTKKLSTSDRSFAFSKDGARLMVTRWGQHRRWNSSPSEISLFEVNSGKQIGGFSTPDADGRSNWWQFLGDGKYLLTTTKVPQKAGKSPTPDWEIANPPESIPVLWELKTGKEVWRLPVSSGFAAAPGGRVVATTNDNRITL